MTPRFFRTAADLRRWLEKNHAQRELWIGFYKKSSGRGGITYKEALDEALCFGWIDGVRKRLDEEAFVQRFTPRQAKSYWSAVNISRAEELVGAGRMHAAGLAAFERRDTSAAARYSFERKNPAFDAAAEKQFRANKKAWEFFRSSPPYQRRVATHWVTSAKRPETRQRRLETLIQSAAAGRRFGVLTPKPQRRAK
jgi:uncharacterized protein YdeI (YjbR/CyaY-like superfamily)